MSTKAMKVLADDRFEEAADCLMEMWTAEGMGEHADDAAKWYRLLAKELADDYNMDLGDVRRMIFSHANDMYKQL